MNLWERFAIGNSFEQQNLGISFHYDKGLEPELHKLYKSFAKWLRRKYIFPVHINVYILNCEKVMLRNGNMAYGSFRWFDKRPPFIRVPSAIENHLLAEFSKDEIYEQILSSLVHELTHYYQWALGLKQSNATSERQANYFRYRIIDKYYVDAKNDEG